ncbi:DUF2752 domain-containing protein [Actinospongicola halichondriae]|uniref:DUF2752 domain-containing protein n=1 Tax=Actinospongicola halichondriae TaxID=3236844 RepID=UPI003D5B2DD0
MTAYAWAIDTSLELSEAEPALERYGAAALTTAAIGGTWVLGRGILPFDLSCPLLSTTGIPCPFCGITRLTDHLVHGNVAEVLARDPGGLVLVLLLALLAGVGVATRLGWRPRRWPSTTPVLALGFAAVVVHWSTTLLGGGFVTR